MATPLVFRCSLLSIAVIGAGRAARVEAQQSPTAIIARATEAIDPLRDSLALRKAGYFAIGFGGGVKDLTPFQGQHWIHFARFVANPAIDIAQPTFMMYLPLGALVPQLRDAERSGDAAKMQAARKKMIDAWSALAAEYRALAPTAEMKARFDLELDQAQGVVAHHHM